jgi:hypothetical protein
MTSRLAWNLPARHSHHLASGPIAPSSAPKGPPRLTKLVDEPPASVTK